MGSCRFLGAAAWAVSMSPVGFAGPADEEFLKPPGQGDTASAREESQLATEPAPAGETRPVLDPKRVKKLEQDMSGMIKLHKIVIMNQLFILQ